LNLQDKKEIAVFFEQYKIEFMNSLKKGDSTVTSKGV
jgi:hypothetical protein